MEGNPLDDVLSSHGRIDVGETLYRHLVEQVPAVVYIDTNDEIPRTLYVSPQIEAIFGRPPEDWMTDRHRWDEAIHPDDRPRVDDAWLASIRSRTPFALDYRVRRPDGAVVWTHDSCVPVVDRSGQTIYWHGVMHDVTASKDTEEALRASEARYRALIENLPAVVYVVAPDDDRKTLYVSPEVEVALGYTRQEWLEQPDIWMELLHPDDREGTLAAHDVHNLTGERWSREYRLIASDGRPVWFRDVATLVRGADGRPMYWQGVQLDITELKRVEDELRSAGDELEFRVLERTHELELANELMGLEIEERRRVERQLLATQERYRLLAEHLPGVTYVWDITAAPGEISYVSPQIEAILGFTREEWARADFWRTRVHPDDQDVVFSAARRSGQTGEPFSLEYRYLAKDGRVVWVLEQAILLERDGEGRPKVFHGLMLDIDDRKQAEARALENELRYRDLAAQVPAITYRWERRHDGSFVRHATEQVRTVLGFSPEEWTARPDFWIERLHPDDRGRVLEASHRALASGGPFSVRYRLIAADGRTVWISDEGRAIEHDADGRPKVWQGIMLNVTDQERAQQELRAAEQRFQALVEQLPAMVYIETPSDSSVESALRYLSPQAESILGYTPAELIEDPTHFLRMLHPDDRDRIIRANEASDRTGQPFDEEYRVIARDGRTVWVHSRASLVRDDDGSPVYWLGVAIDVSEGHVVAEVGAARERDASR